MSLLIRGMKMPKNCLACQLERHHDTAYDYEFRCCPVTGGQTNHYRYERHPDCPLIAVPDHGVVIGADVVRNLCNELLKGMEERGDT